MNEPASAVPARDAPLRRSSGSALVRPANVLARAVAWGCVRTLVGLLAAGILVYYATTG